MAIIHFVNYKKAQSNAGMKFVLDYTMQDKKTVAGGKKFVSGINCTPNSAITEFRNTKRLYGKEDDRLFYHFVQSFPATEKIALETAHEIAMKFASQSEKLKGFEIVVSTHCDREHIHSHFVMNSVNFETGKKFHINENEIQMLMKESDEIIRQYGLSVVEPQPKKSTQTMSDREYRSADKNESWKLRLAIAIDDVMLQTVSREHFITLMELEGYSVKWTDSRKNITYTTPDGFKCRDNKLHEEKHLKGNMENEFRIRKKITEGIERTGAPADAECFESRAVCGSYRTELESDGWLTADTDRNARADSGQASTAGNRKRAGELYESADRHHQIVHGGYLSGDRELSGEADGAGIEIYRADECGDERYVLTGWEDERAVFENALCGGGRNEESFEESLSDFDNSGADDYSVLVDSIYLAADISQIIDDDYPVEDCTTMKHSRQKKKDEQNHGPVMGGM